MSSEERPYIDFNMLLVKDLKERYEDNLKFIAEELPCGVNFNSPKQIREALGKRLDITAENVKIEVRSDDEITLFCYRFKKKEQNESIIT